MVRVKNQDTEFKIKIHNNNGYRYASTVTYKVDAKTKKAKQKYIHWGTVDRDLIFSPNLNFLSLSEEEQSKFIFPEGWTILIEDNKTLNLKHKLPLSRNIKPRLLEQEGQFNNRLYGHIWLLIELAKQMNLITDLSCIFDNIKYIEILLTLAIYPCVEEKNFNQLANWQKVNKTPCNFVLSASYITRFTQNINDNHRMKLIKLRLDRQPSKFMLACDSTTRSAWGCCLADIHWGYNKDNPNLKNTVEVVAYSIETHEPVYYRSFPGNMSDSRTLRTICDDLNHVGINKFILIFDRGYQSMENIGKLIDDNISFIMCARVDETIIYTCLLTITYDENGLPNEMDYDKDTNLYNIQIKYNYTLNHIMLDDDIAEEDNQNENKILLCNLYLDINNRMYELQEIKNQIIEEKKAANECIRNLNNVTKDSIKKLSKKLKYHKYIIDEDNKVSCIENKDAILKAKRVAGYFAVIAYGIEDTAMGLYHSYNLRDEQEKYFGIMKNQMCFDLQRNSSESGKNGRLFILFIGLILLSRVRYVWKTELKSQYSSTIDVLNEMKPIRFVEYPNGDTHITSFTSRQIDICKAFNINPPTECLSKYQSKNLDKSKK